MLNERVGRAQTYGRRNEVYFAEHRGGRVESAGHVEADHRAGTTHLASDERLGITARQSGKVHAFYGRVHRQAFGDRDRAGLGRAHAHGQCLEPAMQQVRPHRVEHGPRENADLAKRAGPVVVGGDDAGHHVAVAADVLGGAVQGKRGAERQGLLEHGSGEGRIDQHRHTPRLADHVRDVDQRERGIPRRLDDDQ